MAEGVIHRGGGQWPSFELVTYLDPGWIAETGAAALVGAGTPRCLVGLSYSANDDLEFLETSHRGRLICFGRTGLSGKICVDPESGAVLQIENDGTTEQFVNSSLGAFTKSVQAVIDRFPFYDSDDELDEYEEVASELSGMIREIDSEGLAADGFWETFISDVSIGDYVTEEIVADLGD